MTNSTEVTNSWDPAFEFREPPPPPPAPVRRDALVWRLETIAGYGPYIEWNIAQHAREALGLEYEREPPWHSDAQPLWRGSWPSGLRDYRYGCLPEKFALWWGTERGHVVAWLLEQDDKQLRCAEYRAKEFHLSEDGRQGVFDPNRAKLVRLVPLKEAIGNVLDDRFA